MKRFKLFSNIALMGLMALGATSCSDWLTLYPQDRIVEEDFWEDKNDLEGVRYAAYKQMAANINKLLVWGDIRSDNYDIASQTGSQNNREVYQNIRAAQLDSTMSLYDWGAVYTTINYCNKVLQHGEEVLAKDPQFTTTEWREMKAEITALRALNYFYLLRSFKDIPYSTRVINSDEEVMDFPVVNQLAVLDTLIHDVRPIAGQARNRFDNSRDTRGLMTNTAIYALLADMYLWRSALREGRDFDKTLINQDCDSVIWAGQKSLDYLAEVNNMNASTFGSTRIKREDFGSGLSNALLISNEQMRQDYNQEAVHPQVDSYDYNFHRSYESSGTEIMFAIQYTQDDLKSNWIYDFYGLEGSTNFIVNDAVLSNVYGSVDNSKTDCRTWYSSNVLYSTRGNSESAAPTDLGQRACLKWNDCRFVYRKTGQEVWVYKQTSDYHNWIIYRQPDVMLMMAEAMIAKADPSAPKTDANLVAAKNVIDAIHKRSNVNKSTGATFTGTGNRESYMRTLMNERQIEFLGEGRRWYDLVRYAERYAMYKIKGSVDEEGNTVYDENGNPIYEKSNAKDRDVIILYDPREPQYLDGTMGVRKMIEDYLGQADSKMAPVYKTRIKNRYGLYCPIYYRELSANHGQLQQNPVWNREK